MLHTLIHVFFLNEVTFWTSGLLQTCLSHHFYILYTYGTAHWQGHWLSFQTCIYICMWYELCIGAQVTLDFWSQEDKYQSKKECWMDIWSNWKEYWMAICTNWKENVDGHSCWLKGRHGLANICTEWQKVCQNSKLTVSLHHLRHYWNNAMIYCW